MSELSQVLRSAIVRCELPPGTLLVENQLVSQFHSTRAKVRAALKRLAHDGFLEPIPRMGHLVTLQSEQEIDELFELRDLLESWAAKEAAAKITDEEIAYLRSFDFSVNPREPESVERSLRANRLFHLRISEIAGNTTISKLLANLLDKVDRILHMGLISAAAAGSFVDDHRALIEALAARDVRKSAAIAHKATKQARTMISKAIGTYWRQQNGGHSIRLPQAAKL